MSVKIDLRASDTGWYDLIGSQSLLPGRRYRFQNVDSGCVIFVNWSETEPAASAVGEEVAPGERYTFTTPNPLTGNQRPWIRTNRGTCTIVLVAAENLG